jgi:hypothetical protein
VFQSGLFCFAISSGSGQAHNCWGIDVREVKKFNNSKSSLQKIPLGENPAAPQAQVPEWHLNDTWDRTSASTCEDASGTFTTR